MMNLREYSFELVLIMNIILFISQAYIILYYFKINNCKFKEKKICITILVISLIIYILLLIKFKNSWYVFYLMPFSYIYIFLTKEKNIKKRILLISIIETYCLFTNYLIFNICNEFYAHSSTNSICNFWRDYLSFLILFIVFNFIIYILIKRFKNKVVNLDSFKSIIIIVSCLLLTYIMKLVFKENFVVFYYFSVFTLLSLHIIYFVFTVIVLYVLNYSKKQEVDSETVSQLNNEISYLKEMIKNQNNSSKEMHDLKNKLYAIKEILKDDPEEGMNLIDEICGVIQSNENMKYTTNDSLNALIHTKRKIMIDKNIEFNCESNILEFDGVNSLDLCVAVGNLLDNAIEGCNDPLKNKIQLKINNVNNFINVMVINTCNTINIGLKSNKEETCHGIGLDNVKKIAKRYNGDVQTMQDGKCFKVSLLIQVK